MKQIMQSTEVNQHPEASETKREQPFTVWDDWTAWKGARFDLNGKRIIDK